MGRFALVWTGDEDFWREVKSPAFQLLSETKMHWLFKVDLPLRDPVKININMLVSAGLYLVIWTSFGHLWNTVQSCISSQVTSTYQHLWIWVRCKLTFIAREVTECFSGLYLHFSLNLLYLSYPLFSNVKPWVSNLYVEVYVVILIMQDHVVVLETCVKNN